MAHCTGRRSDELSALQKGTWKTVHRGWLHIRRSYALNSVSQTLSKNRNGYGGIGLSLFEVYSLVGITGKAGGIASLPLHKEAAEFHRSAASLRFNDVGDCSLNETPTNLQVETPLILEVPIPLYSHKQPALPVRISVVQKLDLFPQSLCRLLYASR